MSFSSVIDLSITFVQYFASIIEGRPDFAMPESFGQVQEVVAVFSIGYDFIVTLMPSLDDFRVYFAAVGVIVPLFFIFLGLTFLNPLRVLIWYLLVLASILMTIVGALGKILLSNVEFLSNLNLSEELLLAFVIAGPILLVACGVMLYFRDTLLSFGAEPISQKETKEERMAEETENIAWIPLIFRLVLGGAMIVFGLVFTGLVSNIPVDVTAGGFATFSVGVGYTLLSLGVLTLIYAFVSVFQCGRVAQWKLNSFLESNFLRLYLIIFSIVYIPIVTPVFLVFNCNTFTCGAGYRLQDEGAKASYNMTTNDGICQFCEVYPGQNCPASLQASICAGSSEDRLESDLALQCDKMRALFWPAAGCMILCCVIGIPAIFYDLISKSVAVLEEKFPLRVDTQEEIKQKERAEQERKKKEEEMLEEQKKLGATPTNNNNNNANKYAAPSTPGGGASSPVTPTHVDISINSPSQSGGLNFSTNALQQDETAEEKAKRKKELEGEEDPNDPNAAWRQKVKTSNNVAKFLYQPFMPNMKYTRLFFLIQKFLSVFLGSFVIRIPDIHPTSIALGSSIFIHTVGFIFVTIILPFLFTFENGIAIIMEVILAGTSVLSVLIFAEVSMPDWVFIIILVCNGVLPVAALIIALILEWTSDRSDEEEKEKKKKEQLKKTIADRKAAVAAKKKADKEAKEAAAQEAAKKKQEEIIAAQKKKSEEEAKKRREAAEAAAKKAAAEKASAEEEAKRKEALAAEEARIKKEEEEALAAAVALALAAAAAEIAKAGDSDDSDDDSDDDEDDSDDDSDLDDGADEETKKKLAALREALKQIEAQKQDLASRAEKQEQENQEKVKKYVVGRAGARNMPHHNFSKDASGKYEDDSKSSHGDKKSASSFRRSSGSNNNNRRPRQQSASQFSDAPVEVLSKDTTVPVSSNENDGGEQEMNELLKKNDSNNLHSPSPALPHMQQESVSGSNGFSPQRSVSISSPKKSPSSTVRPQRSKGVMIVGAASDSDGASPSPPAGAARRKSIPMRRKSLSQQQSMGGGVVAVPSAASDLSPGSDGSKAGFVVGEDGALIPSVTAAFGPEGSDNFLLDEEDEEDQQITEQLPENFYELSPETQREIRAELFAKKRQKDIKRQKQLRKLQAALDAQRDEADKRLEQLQENVDFGINIQVKYRLNLFLMIMGVIGLIALSLSAIGLLADSVSFVTSALGGDVTRTPAVEFVGYGNWNDFTNGCCCTAGIDINSTTVKTLVVEKWVCGNGRIREHLREVKPYNNDTIVDGYDIRSLCATTFNNGCSLGTTTGSSGETIVVTNCPSGVATEYQRDNLW